MTCKDSGLFTLALIVRIPADGVSEFRSYEDHVLPLLSDHGGNLERRLRTADGTTEVHIVAFPSEASFQSYRRDPRRLAATPLLEASRAKSELLCVADVLLLIP